ncbi:T9SS type A sorting domain-containing protein [Flammeovirga sp. OC4]|uniref:T9SS type A sorting domain-containing protein n=1 Tax=Flammeovirga sp. OC4 TaxID=1382345 RepID=UPI0006935768|nr:T9SS type A sorting domain-containing protein [Flammeovirga sp. OC4]
MKFIIITILNLLPFIVIAQTTKVDVNLNVKHTVGEVSTFNREKFIGVHGGLRENDWTRYGDARPLDIKNDFMNGKDVYFGRNTGTITYNINAVLREDPNRPGFVDLDHLREKGKTYRNDYLNRPDLYNYADRNKSHILATQHHPFWPDGTLTKTGWAFSQNDTQEEPFGTATGEYCAHFIKEFHGSGTEKLPEYFEVINEPVYGIFGCEDCGETDEALEKIFKFHNTVAHEVKKVNPDMKVGGYTTAFPNFDYDNFQRWEKRWNKFMDMSGENMDFWSIHLYDWPTFQGKRLMRKGSNLEATLDMLDHASYDKFGVVKPTLVSEYGCQVHSMANQQWSPARDWYYITSLNSMMMTFMDRADNIAKALPFIVLKATWGTANGVPHNWRLFRGEDEPASLTGTWVYSSLVNFYDFWSEVNGTRVDHVSDNVDIQTDAYVEGTVGYVVLNNLTRQQQTVALNVKGFDEANLNNVKVQHLYSKSGTPTIEETTFTTLPSEVQLQSESMMLIRYEMNSDLVIDETSDETKYYATTYYQPIDGNVMTFNFTDVDLVEHGEAVLRIGMGRAHGLSLKPTVKINGKTLVTNDNIMGDLQEQRRSFFGMVEVPIDYELLEKNNVVTIQFPESGGHISSVNMRVFNFSTEIERGDGDVTPPTSVDAEDVGQQIILYPNPSKSEKVQLSFKRQFNIEEIKLTDITGKELKTIPLSGEVVEINTAALKAGIYLVQIKVEGQVISKKLIVE